MSEFINDNGKWVRVSGDTPLPVEIVSGGGGGGGTSFNGQLTQGGSAVSNANPLPASIQGTVPLPTGAATAANQATGNNSLSSIDNKTPALDNSKQPVVPSMTSGGNLSAQTAATGTNWTSYGSQSCKQLTLSNQSGTTIEVRQGGAGVGLQIPTGAFYTFFGITNANQLEVRRVDTSNTQVTITARWEA